MTGDVPRPATMTEHEAVEYIASLYWLEAEPGHDQATIKIGPASAFVLIGALQLAMRHSDTAGRTRAMLAEIIDQLRPLFAGTPGAALLELGDQPELDIPVNCRYPFGSHAPDCPPGGHGFAPTSGLAGCTCPHPAAAHDDGFGCTEPVLTPESSYICPCTADQRGRP
jgi:hypothetical protein